MLHLCYKPKVFKGYHPSIVRLLNAVFYFPIGREDVCGSSLCNRTQDRGDFSIPLSEGLPTKKRRPKGLRVVTRKSYRPADNAHENTLEFLFAR